MMKIVVLNTRIFYSRYCANCYWLWHSEKIEKKEKCPKCGSSEIIKGESHD